MITLTDQFGRPLRLTAPPSRIVSLCPSTTQTLWALGAGPRLVGCTQHCRHPADALAEVPRVGGTKAVRADRVAALAPDLVVSVKEENQEEQIIALAERWPTLILDPVDVPSALAGVRLLGRALGTPETGDAMADEITQRFDRLPKAGDQRVAYLIWRKPCMAAGSNTYIHDVLSRAGLINAAAGLEGRYPALTPETLHDINPDVLLASSEPFPFGPEHRDELQALAPAARVVFVDGETFSWHGYRMLQAAEEIEMLIHSIGRS